MEYSRKKTSNPSRRGRKGKKRLTANQKANLALKLLRKQKPEIREYNLNAVTSVGIPNAGTYYNIGLNPVFASYTDRNGDALTPKHIELNLSFTKHASATSSIIRVIAYQWCNDTDSLSAISDILQFTDVLSPKSQDHRYDSRVYHDSLVTVDTDNPKKTLLIKFVPKKAINYRAGTNSTIESNGVYFLLLSDEATNTPTVSYVWKTKFTDS